MDKITGKLKELESRIEVLEANTNNNKMDGMIACNFEDVIVEPREKKNLR